MGFECPVSGKSKSLERKSRPTLFLFQTQWLKRSRKLDLVVPPAFPIGGMDWGGFQICRCLKTCFQATESKRELISLNFGSFNNFRAASQTPYESFKSGAFPMNMVIYSYILIQHTPNNLETIQKWTQGELGHHHSDRSRADG